MLLGALGLELFALRLTLRGKLLSSRFRPGCLTLGGARGGAFGGLTLGPPLGGTLGGLLFGGGLFGGGLLYRRELGLAVGLFPRSLRGGLLLRPLLFPLLREGGLLGGCGLFGGEFGLAVGLLGRGPRGGLTLGGRLLRLQIGLLHHRLGSRLGSRLGGWRLGRLRFLGNRGRGLAGQPCLTLLLGLDRPLQI